MNSEGIATIWASAIGGAAAIIVGFLGYFGGKRHERRSDDRYSRDTWREIIDSLRRRIDDLEESDQERARKIAELERDNNRLRRTIIELEQENAECQHQTRILRGRIGQLEGRG